MSFFGSWQLKHRVFIFGSQDYKFFDFNVSAIQVTACWMHYDVLYCTSQMKRSLQSRGVHSYVNHTRRKWISILAECAYTYLCSGESMGISVPTDKVPDQTSWLALEKVYQFNAYKACMSVPPPLHKFTGTLYFVLK